jgi:hypothetical protein
MHPLLRLIVSRPQLLADHAQAYADLAAAEFAAASVLWRRRALLNAVAACSLGIAVGLAGVAVMLWSVLPGAPPEALWTLIAVPLGPLLVAVGCLVAARTGSNGAVFGGMRGQLLADLALLREAPP